MLELKQIGMQFQEKRVLDDISITFESGQIIGLVAPNGTGKSTLMNVIMNYLSPKQGQVIVGGGLKYTSKPNEVKIHQVMSMMPDQNDLYNHVSGKNHMKIYQTMWNSRPELIEDTITKLGMASYVKKKTGTYSLGMRQRLCFAMQIVSDTKIMLMDEVMNGLDPTHVEMISQILVEKKREGKTVIIASHLLENLEQYADKIYFFKNGKLHLADDLAPGFSAETVTTIRLPKVTAEETVKIAAKFPELAMQKLPNDTILIDIQQQTDEQITALVSFLVASHISDFHFGKVSLHDLYSMEYQ